MTFAYEGDKPYIFVSYAHKDSHAVLPVIEYLQAHGFRVWFDAGIEAGSEWPDYIAKHLSRSNCVLTFISEDFVNSNNCKRELTFAQNRNKPLLNIYIKDVKLTEGMEMQLGLNQAVYRDKYKTDQDFFNAIARAEMIQSCLEKTEIKKPAPEAMVKNTDLHKNNAASRADISKTNAHTAAGDLKKKASDKQDAGTQTQKEIKGSPANYPIQYPDPKRKKALMWITSLLELSYAVLGAYAIGAFTEATSNGWHRFLLMLIPHTAIGIINLILYRTMGKKLTAAERGDSINLFFIMLLSSLIAIVAGIFQIHGHSGIFLNILISIGLNLAPMLIVCILYVFFCSYADKRK